jgi:hypothetical protein
MSDTQKKPYLFHMPADAYSEDGVDLTLIRWMLSLTPKERIKTLQGFVNSISRARHAIERSGNSRHRQSPESTSR